METSNISAVASLGGRTRAPLPLPPAAKTSPLPRTKLTKSILASVILAAALKEPKSLSAVSATISFSESPSVNSGWPALLTSEVALSFEQKTHAAITKATKNIFISVFTSAPIIKKCLHNPVSNRFSICHTLHNQANCGKYVHKNISFAVFIFFMNLKSFIDDPEYIIIATFHT